ncbi:hypothetical protein JCM8547_005768 [Rhodosporidiobolus lusitaniae]
MPSNANETEGPCCVCVATTTQRCGACQGAGFDLFFCSRERQKLVWFAHKRVCGPNSRPFRFPPLTAADVSIAKECLFERRSIGPNCTWALSTALQNILEIAEDQVLAAILTLVIFPARRPPWKACKKAAETPSLPPSTIGLIPIDKITKEMLDPAWHAGDKALRLSMHLEDLVPDVSPYPVSEDWYLYYQHSALIYSAMRTLDLEEQQGDAASPESREKMARLYRHVELLFVGSRIQIGHGPDPHNQHEYTVGRREQQTTNT